jgi:Ser/Thr protein kinase RdoA (MazF antagonist)
VAEGPFDTLSPQAAMRGVEGAFGVSVDGTLEVYNSYVNRVYGLRGEDGTRWVVKFYRPGRWSHEAILDEHRFLRDCAEAEIPVVAPLAAPDGLTLHDLPPAAAGGPTIPFALYPRVGGRTFELETDDDYRRIGALLGRCHAVGARRPAPHRDVCRPDAVTHACADYLLAGVVHPDCAEGLGAVCAEVIQAITPLFDGVPLRRIHGDCHRGNVIDRPAAGSASGLVLIDFDDMMNGPAVQDLWMILPDHADHSVRELSVLAEGYAQFMELDPAAARLIEPLRFMRMIYFLAWTARQRDDGWFRANNPGWGTRDFWMRETRDLVEQAQLIGESLGMG